MSKKLSLKSTKNEMLDAYEELLKEKAELESKVNTSQKELEQALQEKAKFQNQLSASKPSDKSTSIIYQTPPVDTVEGIIENLNSVQKGISTALGFISSGMGQEAEQLTELQKQIDDKKSNLKNLYDLTVENGILDELITEFESKKKAHHEESL
jgi:vacuolar-type H+-ATPase subunit D/Vma8